MFAGTFSPVLTQILQVFCIGKGIQACPRSAIQMVVLVVQQSKVPVLSSHMREHSRVSLSLETLLDWLSKIASLQLRTQIQRRKSRLRTIASTNWSILARHHQISPTATLMMSASRFRKWQPRPLKLLAISMSVQINAELYHYN